MTYLLYSIIALFVFVCFILMLLVLIQKGRGGGLATAFGGGGGHTAFGAKTGDVLTWATSVVFGIFILLAITLNLLGAAANNRAYPGSTATKNAASKSKSPAPADAGNGATPDSSDAAH